MFTSYAQNFEDVMLWRALKHVENGVYIDVGAQHPVIDSVSLAFYEHDWRGVHVEPSAHYAQLLRDTRPDETVIQAAVNGKGAVLKFYEIPETGLSTCNADIAEQHRASGFTVIETSVPCVTLANIFESCADREIHWLKIDVEGLEEQVLQGWMPSKARPWIVVVESTLPLTQIESHDKWEKLILDLDYKFVYFDGLNRFYLAKKHPELEDAFRAGPNVFDGFVLSGTASSPFCALLNDSLATREQEFSAQVIQGQAEFQRLTLTLATREQELSAQITHGQNEVLRLTQTLATREEELGTQVAQGQAEFQRLTKTLATREEELSAQVTQGQNEVLRLTQKLDIREQELGAQVSQGKAELAEARARLEVQSEELTASQARATVLEAALEVTRKELHDVHQANHQHWQLSESRHLQIQALLSSTSWHITAPLRWIGATLRGLTPNTLKPRAKVLLPHAALYIGRRPRLKNVTLRVLNRNPGLKSRLFKVLSGSAIQPLQPQNELTDIAHHTPRARRIFADLKSALEKIKDAH